MKRKKIISICIIVFACILIFCTYFSKTIKNMLLPSVTVVNLKSGAIGDSVEAEGTVNYENTYKIYSGSNWNVKNVCVTVNQKVKKGDVLGKVDNDAINLAERKQQIEIMKLEDELNTLNSTPNADKNKIQEDEYELSTEKLEANQIRKGLDENGNILSDIDGTIVNINSQSSNSSSNSSSSALFEIADSNSKFSVNFEADSKSAEKFSVGQSINLIKNADEQNNKQNKLTAAITQKNYNSEKDMYEFIAEINGDLNVKAGEKVTVSSIEETKRYNNVIPKSCLSEDGGLDYIYVVNMENDALGGEETVQKVQVEVVASDNINCSIKAVGGQSIPSNYGIVMSTSKEIENNTEVKLDNEN